MSTKENNICLKQSGIFFAILGRGLRAFQIGEISGVYPKIGKFVIMHNYSKNIYAITYTILPYN